ncbi:MAG: DUF115 domain-containing protein [Opitutales bacterium]|nr:DUF115 domain-containing protein [Opitutales bacterium]
MSFSWISTVGEPNAKLAIIIGEVAEDVMIEESKNHTGGILWICEDMGGKKFLLASGIQLVAPYNTDSVLCQRMTDFIALDYQHLPVVKVSSSVPNSPHYDDVLPLVVSKIETTARARRTRYATGFDRQHQVFKNLPGYLLSRVPSEWSSLGKNSFVLVVGAGPSIDITLPIFKKGFPRPIIVACDSSLRALMVAGITPDFVVSMDPYKSFESCSTDGFAPGIAILSSQSHSSWAKQWGEQARYMSGRVLTEDLLAKKGVSKTNILAANNAGLSALAFAHFLNPALIVTVGMDLCSGVHPSDRYAKNTGRCHIKVHAEHYHNIPGNYQKTVKTPFLSDWQETTKLASEITIRRPIFNFTDRGAVLEGATLVHPDDGPELNKAMRDNIQPFETKDERLGLKKQVTGIGLEQILSLLVSYCDQIWDLVDRYEKGIPVDEVLQDIFNDSDLTSILGDFSFVVMPMLQPLVSEKETLLPAVQALKEFTYLLEDAILKCSPTDEFSINHILAKNL